MALSLPVLQLSLAVPESRFPAIAITGLDITALVLLLHVWLVVAGLATWNDDAQTGVAWIDRRVHMSARLYGGLMLVAVIVVWLPFAVGQFPIGSDGPLRRGRTVVVVFAAGGLLVGAGFYFVGGVLTNLRPFLAFRWTDPTDAAAVDSGRVQVSGRIDPLTDTLEAPVTGTEAVCYQLSGTRTTLESDEPVADPSPVGSLSAGSSAVGSSDLLSSLAEGSERLLDRRTPFVLRDDTGHVVVDPTDAQLRLERAAAVAVPEDGRAPEPLASHLGETTDLEVADRDWIYREAVLEPGDEITVLGVADEEGEPPAIDGRSDEVVTITAGETTTEFVLTPGREQQVDRHFFGTILGCAIASIGLIGSGFWILWALAGH